jgi:colanic acid/amylovoran biosynthesis glycosyltransferase
MSAPVAVWNINPLTLMLPLLMKSDSDVFHIHSHLYLTSNQATLAKFLKKRKSLLHLHGGVGDPPYLVSWPKLAAKRFYGRTLGKFTIENSNIIASVSHTDLERIASIYSIPEKRLRYIPNAVDTDKFKPRQNRNDGERTLVYVGDLEPWKGIGLLINWVLNNRFSKHEFNLRFVGQGSCMRQLMALQDRQSKTRNGISVEVSGPVRHDEVPSILNNATGLIHPSYWEGMPTVVLEAMASGVPVISTRVGDVSYLIEDKVNGLLIDRSLVSFENAVKSVFGNPSLVSRIIKNARKLVVSEFSLLNMINRVRLAYEEILFS